MSPPASTTSAPSATSAGTSSRSAARDAGRRPSSGPPVARPAASGTGSPSTTAGRCTPSRRRCADLFALLAEAASGLGALQALLPPAGGGLTRKEAGRWTEYRGATCSLCGAFLDPAPDRNPARGSACGACPGDAPFAFARSLFVYEGSVGDAIRSAKYRGMAWGAPAVAARLCAAVRGQWADRFPAGFRPTIVPVPIRPGKYFRRGLNLPALVGRSLGRLTGWPFDPLALRRRAERRPQAALPLSERRQNVRGAFSAAPGRPVPGEVLLLDDVYTSGATVVECARALKTAGARHIVVLTVARAVA